MTVFRKKKRKQKLVDETGAAQIYRSRVKTLIYEKKRIKFKLFNRITDFNLIST